MLRTPPLACSTSHPRCTCFRASFRSVQSGSRDDPEAQCRIGLSRPAPARSEGRIRARPAGWCGWLSDAAMAWRHKSAPRPQTCLARNRCRCRGPRAGRRTGTGDFRPDCTWLALFCVGANSFAVGIIVADVRADRSHPGRHGMVWLDLHRGAAARGEKPIEVSDGLEIQTTLYGRATSTLHTLGTSVSVRVPWCFKIGGHEVKSTVQCLHEAGDDRFPCAIVAPAHRILAPARRLVLPRHS